MSFLRASASPRESLSKMDTIKQKVISIAVEGRDAINVRRLKWKHAREFLNKMSGHAGQFGTLVNAVPNGNAAKVSIDIDAILANAAGIVASIDDLAAYLVAHSTDLTPEQADELDTLVALEVLRASIELNLGDELKNSSLGIGKTLAALFPSMNRTNTGARSTLTS